MSYRRELVPRKYVGVSYGVVRDLMVFNRVSGLLCMDGLVDVCKLLLYDVGGVECGLGIDASMNLHVNAGRTNVRTHTSNVMITPSGNMHVNGTVFAHRVNTLSDGRTKDNIEMLKEDENETFMKLQPITYTQSGKKRIGLLAQDVKELYPSLIEETDGIMSIDYIGLIPILINEIKQLKKSIIQNTLHN